MAHWRNFELGERIRALPQRCEERLAFDRVRGLPVTLRTYPVPPVGDLPAALQPEPAHLAQPLAWRLESSPGRHTSPPVVVVRALAYGPSVGALIAAGPQPEGVVGAFLTQLLEGLAPLHALDRCHLRLGPEAVRFDLMDSRFKILDLEEAALLPASEALLTTFLDPRLRQGAKDPSCDVYSAGRIAAALLRGSLSDDVRGEGAMSTRGRSPRASAPAASSPNGDLWSIVERLQAPLDGRPQGRPVDAAAALALVQTLGWLPRPSDLALPLASFVRRNARGLRELRRWQAERSPLLPSSAAAPDLRSYPEVLSAARASRTWRVVGFAASLSVALTAGIVAVPRGSSTEASAPRFLAEACTPSARPTVVADGRAAEVGQALLTILPARGAALAVDGCPVFPLPAAELHLAVSRGSHDLRVAIGDQVLAQRVEVTDEAAPRFDLGAAPRRRGGGDAALALLAQRLAAARPAGAQRGAPAEDPQPNVRQPEVEGGDQAGQGDAAEVAEADEAPFDPLEAALIDPAAQRLLAVDGALVAESTELRAELPDGLALALDGLRAARRRFGLASAACEVELATAAAQRLSEGNPTASRTPLARPPQPTAPAEDREKRAQQVAAEFLTATRVHGSQMGDPLEVERLGLAELGVVPSRRLLGVVEDLVSRPSLVRCLGDLGPAVNEIEGLAGLALAQIPGLAAAADPAALQRGLE